MNDEIVGDLMKTRPFWCVENDYLWERKDFKLECNQ